MQAMRQATSAADGVLGAARNSDLVGFAIGDAQTGNIWALFVHPDHERKGFGRQLHDAMLAWLWSQGLDRLWLTTEPHTRAQQFYESAGWILVGSTDSGELRYEMRLPKGPLPNNSN